MRMSGEALSVIRVMVLPTIRWLPCGSLWRKRFRLCEDALFDQRLQQGTEAAPERLGILRLTRLSVRSTRDTS